MSSISATSPRFINTPTVLEDYEADQKGYDTQIEGDAPLKLSREYDRVVGFESLYKSLLEHKPVVFTDTVTGTEGFLGSIANGTKALIQAVKDFFKWLWEFFTGKQSRLENKTEDLEDTLKVKGVKAGDVEYPLSVFELYTKASKPDPSLTWLETEIKTLAASIGKVENYLDATRAFAQAVHSGTTQGTDLEQYLAAVKTHFAEGQHFFGPYKVKVNPEGRISTEKLARDPRVAPGSFKTNLTQVRHLVDEIKGVQNKLETMVNKSVELENGLLKALGKVEETAELEVLRRHIRTSMGTIKELESLLFRGAGAAVNILKAAVND
jgi:hypothetical protein